MLYGDRNTYDRMPKPDADHIVQDLEYLQGMYPGHMRRIQEYVVSACDDMEYKNSPLYDEYPDRLMVNQVCDSVCRRIEYDGMVMPADVKFADGSGDSGMVSQGMEAVEAYEVNSSGAGSHGAEVSAQSYLPNNRLPWGPPPGPPSRPPQGPPSGPPPWGPPPGRPSRPPQGPPSGPPPWGPPPGPPSRPPQGPPPGPPPWGPPPGPPPWGPPSGPPPWGPPSGPPPWGPPPGPPPRPQPRPPQNKAGSWLNDIVKVLLLNEMHRRRCRNGICL